MPDAPGPATTPAASAVAQGRPGDGGGGGGEGVTEVLLAGGPPPGQEEEALGFSIGKGVERGARGLPYERRPDDPLYRPLRIYTLDPAASRLEGAVAVVNVPYEPLGPGPTGYVLRVDPRDAGTLERYRAVDLDDPDALIRSGRAASPSDPRFHQQMVYAVCSLVYAAFRHALGRHVAWGFDAPDGDDRTRLVIVPHGGEARNAWYDPDRGELRFGYFRAGEKVAGRNVPGGYVFTCLSHDVVAHEVTHALLDGLRARFNVPTGPDVLAFHEGFADLVAIFQHFSYPEVVRAAIRGSRGDLGQAALLTDLARQFGHTTSAGEDRSLRTAIELDEKGGVKPRRYDPAMEEHELGSVLVSAVFDAFLTVYRQKTKRYVRLATGGSGILAGEPSADLQEVLAEAASKLAGQFLTVLIRAIDYCPPVDVELGEFLRAVITADYNLVPDDPWGYREAWIDAFGRHGIYPNAVRSLAEDELLWRAPEPAIDPVEALSFGNLRFRGDPACPASADELRTQAVALGKMVVAHPAQFGLARDGDPGLHGDRVDRPRVESIRSSRRVGPDGQVVFDLVAEVTQRRRVDSPAGSFPMYGGATVILGPHGEVRYAVTTNVTSERRWLRQSQYVRERGRRLWEPGPSGLLKPRGSFFRMLHGE